MLMESAAKALPTLDEDDLRSGEIQAASAAYAWFQANPVSTGSLSDPPLTRCLNSLPGLKCGTYLPGRYTDSPDLGFLPVRGGRKWSEKLPKPRISFRVPVDSDWVI